MNNKHKIVITTLIIFLLFSVSLFTYYNVHQTKNNINKYVIKSIKWEEYMINKAQDKIWVFNSASRRHDKYQLTKVDFDEVVSIPEDIVKEVRRYSYFKLERKDFPEVLEYDQNTQLKLSNIIVEPIFINEKQWYDEIDTLVKVYPNLEDADLYKIPKEILENNQLWFLLTDTAKFENIEDGYNCTASYHRIRRSEKDINKIDKYEIKAIYKGKKIINTGNVILQYKLTSKKKLQEISTQYSLKLFGYSILLSVSVISFVKLYKKFKRNI